MIIVSESQFREEIKRQLEKLSCPECVTGPGRSGAIAAVYASHLTGAPFVPFGLMTNKKSILIVDTAMLTGQTMRKALTKYIMMDKAVETLVVYREPPRLVFWYEVI